MEQIASHSFIENLSVGWILDAGCRDFVFSRYFAEKGFRVIALDPDKNISDPNIKNVIFINKALLNIDSKKMYASWSTGEGNSTFNKGSEKIYWYATEQYEVDGISINTLMKKYSINQFKLIKLDIEGDEYDILTSIKAPVAEQISVEFHDLAGRNPCAKHEEYYSSLLNSDFGKIYTAKKMERVDGDYLDVLFVLKT